MAFSYTRLAMSLAVSAPLAACSLNAETSGERPPKLSSVVVPDSDFTFETRSVVSLRLEPDNVSAFTPVQVYDAEGRLLFKGVVQQPLELGLHLRLGATQSLTVISGRGPNALTQELTASNGRVLAKL